MIRVLLLSDTTATLSELPIWIGPYSEVWKWGLAGDSPSLSHRDGVGARA